MEGKVLGEFHGDYFTYGAGVIGWILWVRIKQLWHHDIIELFVIGTIEIQNSHDGTILYLSGDPLQPWCTPNLFAWRHIRNWARRANRRNQARIMERVAFSLCRRGELSKHTLQESSFVICLPSWPFCFFWWFLVRKFTITTLQWWQVWLGHWVSQWPGFEAFAIWHPLRCGSIYQPGYWSRTTRRSLCVRYHGNTFAWMLLRLKGE